MDGTVARTILGVPSDADSTTVRRAFRVAARFAHPDRGGDAGEFRRLITARAVALADMPTPAASGTPGGPVHRTNRYLASITPAPRPHVSIVDRPRPRGTQGAPTAPGGAAPDFEAILAAALAA